MEEKKLTWFQLMWRNGYIITFIVFLLFLIGILCTMDGIIEYSGVGWFITALLIPVTGLCAVGYLGFYQFWKDYKSGKSR